MSQQYLAAYALASLATPNPTAENIEVIFKAVGASVEKDTLAFIMESIDGRDINALITEGAAKMAAVPAAGAAPAAAAAGGAAAPAAAAAAKKEEEPEEEGDDDMGFGLFD